MRWFYYVVLALALFVSVYAAASRHWLVASAAGAVLLFFVLLPEDGL